MADIKNLPKDLVFKYIFSDDYNPKYVNGIYGGITTSGDIVANFYFERHALPKTQTHKVANDGSIGPLHSSEPKDLQKSMVRLVEYGVVLNLNSAKVFHKWLGDQIQVLEKNLNKKG